MNKSIKPGVAVALVLAIIAVVVGVGFFQDEVTGFTRLQGWNTGPVREASEKFVKAAAAGDGAGVAQLIASDPRNMEVERQGNNVVAVKVQDYGGMKRQTLKELCPDAAPQINQPKLVFLEGGTVLVEVNYHGKHILQLSWDLKPEGWRLVTIGRVA